MMSRLGFPKRQLTLTLFQLQGDAAVIQIKRLLQGYFSAWKEIFPFIMIYFCGRMIIRVFVLLELFFDNTLHIEPTWTKVALIPVVFPVLGKCVHALKKNYPEMVSFLLGGVKKR